MAWFHELLPGVDVDLVDWVGADPRQPIHAVVAEFPSTHRPALVLYRKAGDVTRDHLVGAIEPAREPSTNG